ncbi:MAG TPA: M36 family metallopeptidase, partial [Solirubrobacter sp.]|nr:M36 family metallopeptidase [Solirubrobacter sp.]
MLTFALASLALPATAVAVQPNPAQRALERRLGPQAVVDIDASTGTPRVLARLDGTLTGAASGAPEDVAMDYVRRNLDVLGLTASDLETLEEPETSTAGGITQVRWRQAVDGIPAADAELRVNLTRDGRVLNVLGSPVPDLDPDTTPAITAGEAVRAVQDAAGAHRPLPRDRGPSGPTRATSYVDGSDAALALFEGRLAWRVMLHASSREVYDAFVDAETGRVLRKHNMVKSAAGDALVWERYPGATVGGTATTKNLQTPGWLTAGATTLNGRNVHAWSDVDDSNGNGPSGGEQINRRADQTFAFAFTPPPWTFGVAESWQNNREQNAVQAFYFANQFHDHLRDSAIAFGSDPDDAPFEENDKLLLHTDDGADTNNGQPDGEHINNANMLTPPDDQSPVMQMYLWSAAAGFRDANSGDDAAIVFHEYTHGLSN